MHKEKVFICKKCKEVFVKHAGFGLCPKCYKERWRRSKNIPKRGYKSKIPCKVCGSLPSVGNNLCIRCYGKWWRKKQGKQHREYSRKYAEKNHFGAHPEIIKRREQEGCAICGMSNKESLEQYGRNLTIHHKDGRGRLHHNPNHELSNLMVVCRGCHNKLHDRKKKEVLT